MLGVRFSYFDQFIRQSGGSAKAQGLTTQQFCTMFIELKFGKSICEKLRLESSPFVGTPTWFISHNWSEEFLVTVEAIRSTLERVVGKAAVSNTIVWFDLFSLEQSGPRVDIAPEFLCNEFIKNVKATGNMMMVMQPWDNPGALKRAWCVFEAYACVHANSRFEVAMTQKENDRFLETIIKDGGAFNKMLTQINSSKSQAGKASDLQLIGKAIKTLAGGYSGLDRVIFAEMEKWMILLIREKILKATTVSERSHSQLTLAKIFYCIGKFEQAEPLLLDCVSTLRNTYGKKHESIVATNGILAAVYVGQGKYAQAEPLLLEALNGARRAVGNEALPTLVAMNNLATCYKGLKKYDQSERLLIDCLAIHRRNRGDDLTAMVNLALLYEAQGNYAKAESLARDSLTSRRLKSGNEHPDTLSTMSALAAVLKSSKRLKEAEALYLECLQGRRRVLGNNHSTTIDTIHTLGEVYRAQGNMAKAQPLIDEYKSLKANSSK